ncbi:hypothetical protein JHN59_04580 [Streptomyces sp. MBT49]|uniref:hypothetical protein n=1 Tax=unclassified Streptomyces TaxID=2593676 RepID=UPI0019091FF9|nr:MULTISPECIES: hypothetical protein [unclassified Streptomyces]MBK3624124.1 hypothetical protein [Streptomyces sp. MBT49]MBK3636507.1 hypothetical protein [Streptomyces sp. MBT97]
MGLVYSYEIYLRRRDVAGALTALAGLAPPARAVPPLDVTLPDGERLVLPFTSRFESEPVDCSGSPTLELDTSIRFGVDDAVRAYEGPSGREPDEDGRMAIGYVYLTVRFASLPHPGYASMEFSAATSGMSRMFARSARVRELFTDLTAAVGGVCCLFDTGDGGPEEVCWLDGATMREKVSGDRFPDLRSLTATWPDPGC